MLTFEAGGAETNLHEAVPTVGGVPESTTDVPQTVTLAGACATDGGVDTSTVASKE